MNKLQEIKRDYAKQLGFGNWVLLTLNEEYINIMDQHYTEVARRYAKAVAEDALKRAADNATLWVETPINGTEFNTVTKELGDGYDETITVFKGRILSTEINLDL